MATLLRSLLAAACLCSAHPWVPTNYVVLGTPGSGKSTILNGLYVSHGHGEEAVFGPTKKAFGAIHAGDSNYIEFPYEDKANHAQTSKELVEGLKTVGKTHKVIFVIMLENNDVRPQDMAFMKAIREAVAIKSYGIIVNQVPRDVIATGAEELKTALKQELLVQGLGVSVKNIHLLPMLDPPPGADGQGLLPDTLDFIAELTGVVTTQKEAAPASPTPARPAHAPPGMAWTITGKEENGFTAQWKHVGGRSSSSSSVPPSSDSEWRIIDSTENGFRARWETHHVGILGRALNYLLDILRKALKFLLDILSKVLGTTPSVEVLNGMLPSGEVLKGILARAAAALVCVGLVAKLWPGGGKDMVCPGDRTCEREWSAETRTYVRVPTAREREAEGAEEADVPLKKRRTGTGDEKK